MIDGREVISVGKDEVEERFRRDVHALALAVTGPLGEGCKLVDSLTELNVQAVSLGLDVPFGEEVLNCAAQFALAMRDTQARVPRPQPPAH